MSGLLEQALGLLHAGRTLEALAVLDAAREAQPASSAVRHNRALVLFSLRRFEEAAREAGEAVRLDGERAASYTLLGQACAAIGEAHNAEAAWRRSLLLRPGDLQTQYNLALLLQHTGRPEEAVAGYRRVLQQEPALVPALMNLGLALKALGRGDEALAALTRAVQLAPGDAAAHANLGLLLQERGDATAARKHYARALEIAPDHAETLANLGALAHDEGRAGEGIDYLRRSLAARPHAPNAAYTLGLALLERGDFAEGWALCRARTRLVPPVATDTLLPDVPRLEAADVGHGRRTAIWAEQGIGDQVLFMTLLPEWEARGERFVLEADARLAPAIARAHPGWSVEPAGAGAAAFAGCDRQLAIGSLAEFLRPDAASFGGQPRALLAADAARVRGFRARLPAGLRIGISWKSVQSAARGAIQRRKSAGLAAFDALSRESGVTLVDLQYGDTREDRAAFAKGGGRLARFDDLDLFGDVDGVLAAIEACDAVITTSNVTAHFAGALGKSTALVYLRAVPPFHYWAPDAHGRSRWYPSVRIASAPSIERWEDAIAMARALVAGDLEAR